MVAKNNKTKKEKKFPKVERCFCFCNCCYSISQKKSLYFCCPLMIIWILLFSFILYNVVDREYFISFYIYILIILSLSAILSIITFTIGIAKVIVPFIKQYKYTFAICLLGLLFNELIQICIFFLTDSYRKKWDDIMNISNLNNNDEVNEFQIDDDKIEGISFTLYAIIICIIYFIYILVMFHYYLYAASYAEDVEISLLEDKDEDKEFNCISIE